MAEDFPLQGGSSGTWGTEYSDFFKQSFHMSGTYGGQIAIVCNEDQVVCNENEVVMNTDRSIQ